LEASQALGYHVNQLARGLMRSESGIVCLHAPVIWRKSIRNKHFGLKNETRSDCLTNSDN
jgi:DNA-binding LacI/PurR family transcriptional regulator